MAKKYNKLVRDNIPEIMIDNGAKPVIRVLTDEEYINELSKKLLEEVNEFLEERNIEELADIQEVLLAILKYKKCSKDEFEQIRLQKVIKRGAFDRKIFLIEEK